IMVSAALLGALAGFLRYNFNPASIFLGDSGSLLLGFILAGCAVAWAQHSATIIGLTAPVIAMAVPLFDTGISIVRRFLRRQPIFSADRDHIHHRLLDRGFSTRFLVIALYIVAALMGGLALLETTVDQSTALALGILAFFGLLVLLSIQYLR